MIGHWQVVLDKRVPAGWLRHHGESTGAVYKKSVAPWQLPQSCVLPPIRNLD